MLNHAQGCHKCGGFPGHQTKDRMRLLQCRTCGTYTCNQHLTVMGACPHCGESKMQTVLPGKKPKKAKKPVSTGIDDDDFQDMATGGGLRSSAGLPSSESGQPPPMTSTPSKSAPQEVKQNQAALLNALSEQQMQDLLKQNPGKITVVTADPADFLKNRIGQADQADEEGGASNILIVQAKVSAGDAVQLSDDNIDELFAMEDETPREENGDASTADEADDAYPLEGISEADLAEIESEFDELESRRQERMAGEAGTSQLISLLDEQEKHAEMILVDCYFRFSHRDTMSKYNDMMREALQTDDFQKHFLMGVVSYAPAELQADQDLLNILDGLPNIYAAVGYSPRCVSMVKTQDALQQLSYLLTQHNQIIALGDVGLDLHYAPYTLDAQKELLYAQLKLAAELKMPVYLNSVRADDELADFIDEFCTEHPIKGIYTGLLSSDRILEMCEKHDFHVCIRPELTYPENEAALERLRAIKSVRWLLCSGPEHTAPDPHRGEWNTPRYILDTVQHVAKTLEREPVDLAILCCKNWARLLFSEPAEKEFSSEEEDWNFD